MVQFAPPLPPKAPAFKTPSAPVAGQKSGPETGMPKTGEKTFTATETAARSFSSHTPETAAPAVEAVVERESSNEIPEPGLYDDNFAAAFGLSPAILRPKSMGLIFGGLFLAGIAFGALLFGGSSQPQQSTGLQGVIANPDIKTKLQRCGRTDNSSACVLYIVNHSPNDQRARDFFDAAVKLTGRQRYAIEIDNPAYANTRIPAGYFAQIKIPSMR